MADPYLSDDESVVLAADNVLFKSVSLAAIFTSKRILLVKSEGNVLTAEEILLSRIRAAEIDENAILNPVVRVSFIADSGETKQETLTFFQKSGQQRKAECEDWVNKLREHILPSPREKIPSVILLSGEEPVIRPEEKPVFMAETARPVQETAEARAAVPETGSIPPGMQPAGEILAKHDRPAGLSYPAMPPLPDSQLPEPPPSFPQRKLVGAVAIIIVIIAVIGGALYYTQFMQVKPAVPPIPVTTIPAMTTAATAAPVPVTTAPPETPPAPAPSETASPSPSPSPSQPQVPVPPAGVWVRVNYPGNYTGTIGVGSSILPVADTGEHFYQLATKTGTIKAIIQKEDGSGNLLTVDMYQDGILIQRGTTTAPKGEVNIQIDLKTAVPTTTVTVIPNVTTQAVITLNLTAMNATVQ